MRIVHFVTFGIVPPVNTTSANGDLDLHVSPSHAVLMISLSDHLS